MDKTVGFSSSQKRKCDWVASSFGDFGNSAAPSSQKHVTKVLKKATVRAVANKSAHTKKNNRRDDPVLIISDDEEITLKEEKSDEPWVVKYKPHNESDLAIHKKKISDVRQWLLEQFQSNKCGNILLLTGPSGSGKTACIEVLAQEMNAELREWINPQPNEYKEFDASSNWREYPTQNTSQVQQFKDFLLRANRYNGLCMTTGADVDRAKIVLVEDIPNLFFRDAKKLHEILRQYLCSGRSPLVIIVSDTSDGDASCYKILPKSVQLELNITNISFNAAANTSLMKCMKTIIEEESKHIDLPSSLTAKDSLDLICSSSGGDIRSCVNSLQFTCTNYMPQTAKENIAIDKRKARKTTRKTAKKSVKSSAGADNEDQPICELQPVVTGRDASLFLFRALGKILYCKRTELSEDEKSAQLPEALKQHRRNALLVDPEDVFEHAHITSDTMNLYLHQNYFSFFNDVDSMSMASETFSDADLLMSEWTSRSAMADYSASTGMRGLMFALGCSSNSNKSEQGSSSGRGGGWKPLHKPQWFEMFKNRNSNKRTASDLFHDLRCPPVDLFTEVLPYLMKTGTKNRTQGHSAFVRSMAIFPLTKQYNLGFRLEQLDTDMNGSESLSEEPHSLAAHKDCSPAVQSLPDVHSDDDDEDVIEDFDEFDDDDDDFYFDDL